MFSACCACVDRNDSGGDVESRPSTPAPVVRFPIALPEGLLFARRSLVLAVSPDGSQIAYVAGAGQLYLRSMTDMEARPIPGTNLDVMSPFFSPDGQSIGFYSFKDSTLKKVAVTGGLPVTICQSDLPPYGITWDRDWIVFADQGAKGILRVSANGGLPEVLVPVQSGEVFAAPQMLNDGACCSRSRLGKGLTVGIAVNCRAIRRLQRAPRNFAGRQ